MRSSWLRRVIPLSSLLPYRTCTCVLESSHFPCCAKYKGSLLSCPCSFSLYPVFSVSTLFTKLTFCFSSTALHRIRPFCVLEPLAFVTVGAPLVHEGIMEFRAKACALTLWNLSVIHTKDRGIRRASSTVRLSASTVRSIVITIRFLIFNLSLRCDARICVAASDHPGSLNGSTPQIHVDPRRS